MGDESSAKVLPMKVADTNQDWLNLRFDALMREIQHVGDKMDTAIKRLEKSSEDHEQRLRAAERERQLQAAELSTAKIELAQQGAERKADMASVEKDIARLEAKLDAVIEQQDRNLRESRSFWQELAMKAIPMALAAAAGGGSFYAAMEIFAR